MADKRDKQVDLDSAAGARDDSAAEARGDPARTAELPQPGPAGGDRRPLWLRLAVVIVPAAAGVPLVALPTSYLLQLVGTALCLIALYGFFPQLSVALQRPWTLRGRPLAVLPAGLPAIALVFVAAALLWPALLGMMPQSQDHPVHLTRAWHFVTRVLADGQLSGWSDLWFAGYPAGEDYPPGADWWIGTLYLGTFGLLGWEASYGIAFLAMYAVAAYAIYTCGRVYFGRLAGFCGGLFFLLDRGQYREGGWNYTVWWGVWPQVLSTAFTFFTFAALDNVIRRARPRDFAVCALVAGFALLAHPVAMIYFGLGVPIYLAARVLGTDERAGPVLARALGALALGGALAAFWVLPFTAKSAWMAKYGELWKSLPTMADGLWKGTLFDNITPPLVFLAVLGGAVAAWRRSFAGIFIAGVAATTMFVASSTAFQRLDLLALSPAFGQIQFQRLSIYAKPCMFLLAGFALQVLFARVGARRAPFSWRRYALACLLLLAVAPFVRPAAEAWGKKWGRELGAPRTRRDLPQWRNYQRFLAWSAELRQREGDFYRIAYVRPYNDHFFAAAPVYNKTPAYKVGYTPAINFIHKPDVADTQLYRKLSVKYVVTMGGLSGRHYELVRRFGAISVYRFRGYSPERFTLRGRGRARVLRFAPDDGEMRLEVSGAGADSRLVLHVANYPNWRATVDGEPLPITTAALGKHEIFISVAARNGTIAFSYTMPAVNVVGALCSWAAIAVLLLLAVARWRPAWVAPLRQRARPWGQRAQRWGVLLAVVALLLPVLGLVLKGRRRPRGAVRGRALIERLDRARVEKIVNGRAAACSRNGQRHQCTSRSWNHVGPSSQRVGDALRRCIWAHPAQGQALRITFPDVRLGRALVGHHGLTDNAVRSFRSGAPMSLEVSIDGKLMLSNTRPNTKGWEAWRVNTADRAGQTAEISFKVSTRRAGGRHYCFDAVVVE